MTYVIDDRVAIDAGCLGLISPIADQKRVTDVFLTHSHADHLASLPIFIDNVYQEGPDCVAVWGGTETLDCLRRDVFNDRIWPDLAKIARPGSPFARFQTLATEQTVVAGHLKVTAIELSHVVPTFAYLVEDADAAVAFVSDTGPTQRVWQLLDQQPRLRGVFLEASFPDEMLWLAQKSGHLTPRLAREELRKLHREARVIAVHVKGDFHAQVAAQLAIPPAIEMGVSERIYQF